MVEDLNNRRFCLHAKCKMRNAQNFKVKIWNCMNCFLLKAKFPSHTINFANECNLKNNLKEIKRIYNQIFYKLHKLIKYFLSPLNGTHEFTII